MQFALDYDREVFFHEASLSKEAKAVSEVVLSDLKKVSSVKKTARVKMENTVERYLEDGASVIKNFEDFSRIMK